MSRILRNASKEEQGIKVEGRIQVVLPGTEVSVREDIAESLLASGGDVWVDFGLVVPPGGLGSAVTKPAAPEVMKSDGDDLDSMSFSALRSLADEVGAERSRSKSGIIASIRAARGA